MDDFTLLYSDDFKKSLNNYSKGRLSVIKEIYEFSAKDSLTAVRAKNTGSDFKDAHLCGVIRTHNKLKMQLKKKISRIKNR